MHFVCVCEHAAVTASARSTREVLLVLSHALVELCALRVSSGIQHMRLRLCLYMSLTLLHAMYVVVLLMYASHTSTYYIGSRTRVSAVS